MAISRTSIEVHAIAGKHGTLSKNYLGEESGAEYSVSTNCTGGISVHRTAFVFHFHLLLCIYFMIIVP